MNYQRMTKTELIRHIKLLNETIMKLRKELDHEQRKAEHGCTDAHCPECDGGWIDPGYHADRLHHIPIQGLHDRTR